MATLKSELKKKYILDRAKEVFIARGFATVTMKDIVEACEISRGGLYRYFGSTRDIFLALFVRETDQALERTELVLTEDTSAREIIDEFLKRRKADILEPSLHLAAYEFFVGNPDDQVVFRWQFDGFVEMFREILEYGKRRGEFQLEDVCGFARHLALFLNNMEMSATFLNIPEAHVDEQFAIVLSPLA